MKINPIISNLNPRLPVRYLTLMAFLVWGFAGFRVFKSGNKLLLLDHFKYSLLFVAGFAFYFPFFIFVFSKVIRKHITRIVSKSKEKVCVFSFLNLKSYLLMIVMIIIGITFKKTELIPEPFLGAFLISLGLCLLTTAIYFLYYFARWQYCVSKFTKTQNT